MQHTTTPTNPGRLSPPSSDSVIRGWNSGWVAHFTEASSKLQLGAGSSDRDTTTTALERAPDPAAAAANALSNSEPIRMLLLAIGYWSPVLLGREGRGRPDWDSAR